MKKIRKSNMVIALFFSLLCLIEGIAIVGFVKQISGLPAVYISVAAGMAVLFLMAITILLGRAVMDILSHHSAYKESGLKNGQIVNVVDYAHSRVISVKVEDVFFWKDGIAVTGINCCDGHAVCYISINDVFVDKEDAVNANNDFMNSQLRNIEEHFDVTLSEEGESYFRRMFTSRYSDFTVITYQNEWDVSWCEAYMSKSDSAEKACREFILERGYAFA